jgi:DNA gyrase subunit B
MFNINPTEDGLNELEIVMKMHGIDYSYFFRLSFIEGPEYKKIRLLNETINGLMEEGAYIQRGEKTLPVETFEEALVWLMKEAERGQYKQRYKGLGEMNPEQLWETTMDPSGRRMLQVKIEDAISADQLFTTLMGDHVEPRREFIETNALNVENLDV